MHAKQKPSKILIIALWTAQGILAIIFLWAGYMKLIQHDDFPFLWGKENPGLVTLTGIIDLAAAVGILVPSSLRIFPWISILASYGIVALMLTAAIFHVSRGEAADIGFNIFMAFLALYVIWGRARLQRRS
ncbi:DoxX family protein [Algoriphagus aestuariicola]|uniref:DoxX family protein n=1 Tax=Algoriphagus aestuariicola TaxID=1852016 RepID=A0ABS3BQN9_9BACT|nr:DoxX family protein [Algoriphagus aestuariicola]MBN7801473.1 DoxX family protein [Algoriphagus aestuariicola]